MTLITHFRTEKYAIVASDGMEIELKAYGCCNKIIPFGKDKIIATYGSYLNDSKLDKFIKGSNGALNYLEEQLQDIEFISEIPLCLVVISRTETTLYFKRIFQKNSQFINVPFSYSGLYEYNIRNCNNEVDVLKRIVSNPIFFNQRYLKGVFNIDFENLRGLKDAFDDSYEKTFRNNSIDLTQLNNLSKTKEMLKEFYLNHVYKKSQLHNWCVSGDILMGYIELSTGKVQFETIHEEACKCGIEGYTNRDKSKIIIPELNDGGVDEDWPNEIEVAE